MNKQQKNELLIAAMDEYGHYLKRTVFGLVRDLAKTEDIVQETFLRYYHSLEQFEQRASVKTYLYRIAINECKNYFKSWSYRKLVFTKIFDNDAVHREPIDKELIQREERENFVKLINALPFKYKEVIWLHYYAELSVQEIATILSCSSNTVKTRLMRGRKLAKLLIEEELLYDEFN